MKKTQSQPAGAPRTSGMSPAVALAMAAGMLETGRLEKDAALIQRAKELEAQAYAALQAGRDSTGSSIN